VEVPTNLIVGCEGVRTLSRLGDLCEKRGEHESVLNGVTLNRSGGVSGVTHHINAVFVLKGCERGFKHCPGCEVGCI